MLSARKSIHDIQWCRSVIFIFFHTSSTFGTGNGNGTVGIFASGLVFLIYGSMEHIMRPTRSYSVQNSGRDLQTLRTHIHTRKIKIASIRHSAFLQAMLFDIISKISFLHRFIHEWICVLLPSALCGCLDVWMCVTFVDHVQSFELSSFGLGA
jgi:hypothetical protein